jgi:acetoin utilization deacetylase AcuC-like enzyme
MRRHLVYSKKYNPDLASFGIDKPFALDRADQVLNRLSQDMGRPVQFVEPQPVTNREICLVHDKEYLESLGTPQAWIDLLELKEHEYHPAKAKKPLPQLIDSIKLKCGGTVLATELALEFGLSCNLGGGYPHAFPNQGRGFCALNDLAIAIRCMRRRKRANRFLVVDLDFHQGDGTALIFKRDPDVFSLSVHSLEGWPEEKQESTLDIPIKASESEFYLEKAVAGIETAMKSFSPEVVLYVAGSDPYEEDVLRGTRFLRLGLTQMKQRDQFVIDYFADRKIPLMMVFSGGYGPQVWRVHYYAVRRLLERSGSLIADPIVSN